MNDIPDELVEKAAQALSAVGDGFGYKSRRQKSIAVLEAVGLPALLERMESAGASPYSTETAYAQLDREHPTWRTRAASDETSPNLRDWLSSFVRPRLSAADLTQADAAAFIGTSEKHLSQILNGRADASIAMWQRLLDFVNADFRAALTEAEKP